LFDFGVLLEFNILSLNSKFPACKQTFSDANLSVSSRFVYMCRHWWGSLWNVLWRHQYRVRSHYMEGGYWQCQVSKKHSIVACSIGFSLWNFKICIRGRIKEFVSEAG
jgi:hypothetical protein